jgi:hypothetical protein
MLVPNMGQPFTAANYYAFYSGVCEALDNISGSTFGPAWYNFKAHVTFCFLRGYTVDITLARYAFLV